MKKGRKKKIFESIIGIIVVIAFICSIFWIASTYDFSKDFCEELGFLKVTDEYVNGWEVVGVECDKKYVYNVCKEKGCISKNKWGICTYEYYLVAQNGTTIGECEE